MFFRINHLSDNMFCLHQASNRNPSHHPWLMRQLFPKDTPSKYVFCPLICATSHSPFLIVTKAITEATRWGVRIIIQPWLWGSVAAAFRAGGVLIPSSACRAFYFLIGRATWTSWLICARRNVLTILTSHNLNQPSRASRMGKKTCSDNKALELCQ